MNFDGPIILIDDDPDDNEIFCEALKEVGCTNEILCFQDGIAALEFFAKTHPEPFLIISDINIPTMGGFEFKEELRKIQCDKLMGVPLIFMSTLADQRKVSQAYAESVQGIFTKPSSYEGIKDMFDTMISYWKKCVQPEKKIIQKITD
jgi:CheY-like chemotaxis protein